MQTYSHLIISAALSRRLKRTHRVNVATRAFLLGSLVPDVPLILLSLGYFIQIRYFAPTDEFIFGATYDNLYYNNPFWITGHSVFHSPVMIGVYALIGWLALRRGRRWGWVLLWFAAGCGLHSFIDILTHYNDGPLLFFPLDWETRFTAPISYWDPERGGLIFAPIEHLLDLALLAYLFITWRRDRREKAAQAEQGVASP